MCQYTVCVLLGGREHHGARWLVNGSEVEVGRDSVLVKDEFGKTAYRFRRTDVAFFVNHGGAVVPVATGSSSARQHSPR
jgi:hypothetical protein